MIYNAPRIGKGFTSPYDAEAKDSHPDHTSDIISFTRITGATIYMDLFVTYANTIGINWNSTII